MNDDTFKKITSVLYLKESEAAQQLTPFENERRKRWVFGVSKRMENPLITDNELVKQLEAGFAGLFLPVSQTTAYRDIGAINKLIGNIQLSAKNWYRYLIIEGAKAAYEIARVKQDGKGMAAALDKIGKYMMLDKPDNDFDWEKMIPPDIEPSADADLLENVEKIDNINQRRIELRRLFKSDMKLNATDIVDENG